MKPPLYRKLEILHDDMMDHPIGSIILIFTFWLWIPIWFMAKSIHYLFFKEF